MRCHAMGKCSGQACAISLGIDPSAPLDCYFVYDEHSAAARASHDVACSSYQSCTFDIAGARRFLGWSEFSIPANLLFRSCLGARSAGDRMAQQIRAFFDLGGRLVDRAWHNLLATSSWPSGCKIG